MNLYVQLTPKFFQGKQNAQQAPPLLAQPDIAGQLRTIPSSLIYSSRHKVPDRQTRY